MGRLRAQSAGLCHGAIPQRSRPLNVGFSGPICRVLCREKDTTRHQFGIWNQWLKCHLSGLSGFWEERASQRNRVGNSRLWRVVGRRPKEQGGGLEVGPQTDLGRAMFWRGFTAKCLKRYGGLARTRTGDLYRVKVAL